MVVVAVAISVMIVPVTVVIILVVITAMANASAANKWSTNATASVRSMGVVMIVVMIVGLVVAVYIAMMMARAQTTRAAGRLAELALVGMRPLTGWSGGAGANVRRPKRRMVVASATYRTGAKRRPGPGLGHLVDPGERVEQVETRTGG